VNYQKLILVGNATDDAQRLTSRKGDVTYTSFSVGVGDGKDHATFFPVIVFGEHGEAVAKYVTKGRQVLVDGRVRVSEKGRFSIVADRVRLGPEPAVTKNSR
jgi:single-strand DNA-binding protein